MLNRNYGQLRDDARIIYAPTQVKIGNVYYPAPTAEQYAACGWLPVDSTKPEKVGVYYAPTEYGDVVDGRIVRRYDEHPVVAPVKVYSVEEIIYGLITHNALQAVKQIVGDYWELMTMRDTIAADNEIMAEVWPAIKAAIVASGALTEDEISEVLKDAEVGV